MLRFRWVYSAVVLALTLIAGLGMVAAQSVASDSTVLRFDIAEIASRYVFDESFAGEEGMPGYGAPFITQGYIYPEGTLNGSNGVLENSEPEFPELVLGMWICKGWAVWSGVVGAGDPAAVTTQMFQFGDVEDHTAITTGGYEMMDVDIPVTRVITGGSGEHFAVRGEQEQMLLGFTEQMGVNLRVELRLSNAANKVNPEG